MDAADGKKRRGRPKASESRDGRTEILRAAERMFARRGYSDTTVEEIALAAGTSESGIYHHFGGKLGLFDAASRRASDAAFARFEDAVASHPGFRERLRAIARAAASLHLDPDVADFIVNLELEGRRNPQVSQVVAERMAPFRALYARIAADAIARSEIGSGVGQQALESFLRLIVTGIARASGLSASPRVEEDFLRTFDLLIEGRLLSEK